MPELKNKGIVMSKIINGICCIATSFLIIFLSSIVAYAQDKEVVKMNKESNFELLIHPSKLTVNPNEELSVDIFATGGCNVTAGKLAIASSFEVEFIDVTNNKKAKGGLFTGFSPEWWSESGRFKERSEIPYYSIETGKIKQVVSDKEISSDETENFKYRIDVIPPKQIKLKSNTVGNHEVTFVLSYLDENGNWKSSTKSLIFHVNTWQEIHHKILLKTQICLATLAIIAASLFAINTAILK